MKVKTLILIILIIVALVVCVKPMTVHTDKEPQRTYVWFEDLVLIDGKDATSGMLLTEGEYIALLIDGSEIPITVIDGYWYFS